MRSYVHVEGKDIPTVGAPNSGRSIAASLRDSTRRSVGAVPGQQRRRYHFRAVVAGLPLLITAQLKALGHGVLGGVDVTLIALALLLAVAAIELVSREKGGTSRVGVICVFTLIALISMIGEQPSPYLNLKSRDFFLVTVPAIAALSILLRSDRDLLAYLRIWPVAGSILTALVLVTPNDPANYGREGLGLDTLGVAYMIGCGVVLALFGLTDRWLPAPFALTVLSVGGLTLVRIGSRGPLLSLAAGVVWWLWTTLHRSVGIANSRWRKPASALLLTSATAAGWSTSADFARRRLLLGDQTRTQLRDLAWHVWADHPYRGVGWSNYARFARSSSAYPHNLVAEVAAELGLVGLLSLAAILVLASLSVIRCRQTVIGRSVGALGLYWLVGQQLSFDVSNRLFWLALLPSLCLNVSNIKTISAKFANQTKT
jgi:O-antigen ligase